MSLRAQPQLIVTESESRQYLTPSPVGIMKFLPHWRDATPAVVIDFRKVMCLCGPRTTEECGIHKGPTDLIDLLDKSIRRSCT